MNKQVNDLLEYLKKHHYSKENGISRELLSQKLGVNGGTLKDLRRQINESTEIEKLVSTSRSCYLCKTDAECLEAIRATIMPAVAMIKKARIMAKKMGLNGQVKIPLGDDYKEVVEVFEK